MLRLSAPAGALMLLAGCTVVRYSRPNGPTLTVIAPPQARITIGIQTPPPWTPALPAAAIAAANMCVEDPDLPIQVDTTMSSWFGTTVGGIFTAFFTAVTTLGWP